MKRKLNIFHSDFGIKANLKTKELEIQNYWKEINLLEKINHNKNKNFVLHIGPPYANGDIHIGHALNFILKDICIRFESFQDKKIKVTPGWDTHGLPIALMVKKQNKDIPSKQNHNFREECRIFANKQVQKQQLQIKRLGTQINFENKYLTMKPQYIQKQLEIFAQMIEQNLIFQSLKPVYWSWSSETALADTEVEYLTKKSNSVYILFPLLSFENGTKKTSLLVWTTTPWTIPANQYLAINQNYKYLLCELSNRSENIIIAENVLPKIKQKLSKDTEIKIIKTFLGKTLLNQKYQHPYLKLESKIIHSNHVKLEEGTGIVHIAPAHGLDDFALVEEKNKVVCMVDDKGFFNHKTTDAELKGCFYQKAEKIIIQKMINANNLFAQEEIKHKYPHDWRTKKPVIYLLTKQWYLNLKPLHKTIEKIIQETEWIPHWGKKRMQKTLSIRDDWCLSRQRLWGVPMPVFINKKKESVLKSDLVKHIANLIGENDDDIWWNWKLSDLLTVQQIEKYQIVGKSSDTFDVWLDSGCSSQILHPNETIDVIWEGHDQYRGWFNSSIIIAALQKKLKTKKILTHGFVNDATGKKMSKSVGNIIDPLEVCQNYGADVLRLWVVSSDYFEDVHLDNQVLKHVAGNYVKIRNTMRFLINNLVDFKPQINYKKDLNTINYAVLIQINILLQKIKKYYQAFQFQLIYQTLNNFFINDLSALYFDYAKPILYPRTVDDLQRRQIQMVFFYLWKKILLLWAPIMPHTSEEAYQSMKLIDKKKSIHLETWPKNIPLDIDSQKQMIFLYRWEFLIKMRKEIHQILEQALKNKIIKTFKSTTVLINYDPKYDLFANKNVYKNFCDKFDIKEEEAYEKANKIFQQDLSNVETIKNLEFFFKTQKIIFTKETKGQKTKIGWIMFKNNEGVFCQHCNWKLTTKQKQYCEECQ